MGESSCTHQINGFCSLLRGIVTPRFTPQPLLWEGLNWYLVDHVVWQILLCKIRVSSYFHRVQDGRSNPPPKPTVFWRLTFVRVFFFPNANIKWWINTLSHSTQSPLEKSQVPTWHHSPINQNKHNTTHLIKVGQTVWILTKTLILSSESISSCYLSELLQIHNIQSTTWKWCNQ